jgi:hypothetical protein
MKKANVYVILLALSGFTFIEFNEFANIYVWQPQIQESFLESPIYTTDKYSYANMVVMLIDGSLISIGLLSISKLLGLCGEFSDSPLNKTVEIKLRRKEKNIEDGTQEPSASDDR